MKKNTISKDVWSAAVEAARAVWEKAGKLPAPFPVEENADSAAYLVLQAAGVQEPLLQELTTLANSEARLSVARGLGIVP